MDKLIYTGSRLGSIGQGVLDAVNKHVNSIKNKDIVKQKAIKESENIFKKNNPQYAKTGYPKVDESNYNTPYGKEAMRVQDQVIKTRLGNIKK